MTDHDPRLSDALRPTPADERDADRIVDAVLAGRAPATAAVHREATRRRRWLVPAAAAASAVLLAAAVGVWRPFAPDPNLASHATPTAPSAPSAPSTPSEAVPADATFTVTCGANGSIAASAEQVAASPDGVHVRVDNRTGTRTSLTLGRQASEATTEDHPVAPTVGPQIGHDIPPGSTDLVLVEPPGALVVRCGRGAPVTVQVHDPHAYYRGGPTTLACTGDHLALDVPDEAAGRGQSPDLALIDLATRHAGTRTTDARFIYLGYRDAPVVDAIVALPDGSDLRARVVTEKGATGSYSAWPQASCARGFGRTSTAAPVQDTPVVTRTGRFACPDGAQPSWAIGPAYGPTPQQAAASLTTRFGDGRLRPVSRWPEEDRDGAQTWAMEVDGAPVVAFTLQSTTPRQAAFGQGYVAYPDWICSMSALQAIGRTR